MAGTGAGARTTTGLAWQTFGFLGGMTVYALYHLVGTALVPLACEVGSSWMITATSALSALVIIAAMAVSWRVWHAGAGAPDGVSGHRTVFLGVTGFVLNALALAIVFAAELHVQVLDPCLPG